MKTLTILFALIATAMAVPAASSSPASAPRHYVVAIGAGLPANQREELFKQSMDLLLNRAQPGDQIEFLAAPQGNLLAAVVVPAGTSRARANSREYAAKFGTLKEFLAKPATSESRMAAQLRLPQLLDEIARAHRPQENLTLIVIGSPLYLASNEREAAFDMEKGLTPSDGMITASVNESIFGTLERKAQLQNTTIHWLTPSDDWAVGEMHQRAVTRFWTLFASEEGAVLSSFSSDIARVFDRALQGATGTVINVTLDPNEKGLVMRPPPIFRRETAPPVESGINVPTARTSSQQATLATNSIVSVVPPVPRATKTSAPPATSLPPPLPSASPTQAEPPELVPTVAVETAPDPAPANVVVPPQPEPAPLVPPAQPVRIEIPKEVNHTVSSIGLFWSDRENGHKNDLDFSLRVKPSAGIKDPGELYWNTPPANKQGTKSNALGRYLHDYRSGDEDYEWIELSSEIDAAKMDAAYEVWCDNYSGRGPVTLTAVLVDHGKIIATRKLTIPGDGDRRWNSSKREHSGSWVRIPIEDMVGGAVN